MSRHKRSAAVSRRPAAAGTNIEMPVVFIARANFTHSGTLLLVAQASGLLFPASRRKPFATTIIFPTTVNPHAASPREIWRDAKFNRRDACSTQKHPGGCCVRPVQRIGALEFTLQRGSNKLKLELQPTMSLHPHINQDSRQRMKDSDGWIYQLALFIRWRNETAISDRNVF